MGFSGVDDIIYRSSGSFAQAIPFYRLAGFTQTAVCGTSFYRFSGFPSWNTTTGGVYPAVGKTATILSQSMSGALTFQAAPSGTYNYVTGIAFGATLGSAIGTAFLVDWIAHCQLNLSETNGNFTGFSAVDRLEATGTFNAGAKIWCEVSENLSNTISQFTFTYTNQDGIAGRVTPVITTRPSATLGTSILPNSGTFIPLQGADLGVRSIESIQFLSGSTISTGKYLVALVRPLQTLWFNSNMNGLVVVDFDYVTAMPTPERIYDDSYLSFVMWPATTIQFQAAGQVRLVAG